MKIAFIGGGNMASALAGGLVQRGQKASDLSVVEVDPGARKRIAKLRVKVFGEPDEKALAGASVILLAVKPQQMRAAARALAPRLKKQLVISVAAGIRLLDLGRWLGGHRALVRCMPNTPALIGSGITGLYAPAEVGPDDRKTAETILRAVGEVVWLKDERLLDPVTAVSASGPAYVFWFIEQLAAYAESAGIPREDALRLAKHCVFGSAKLALGSDEPPAQLRKNVTSKGGTTEAALNVFEQERLAEGFAKALAAATRRGGELGDELAKD